MDFYEYMKSKELKSDHHINSLLTILIFLDKFYHKPFTSINAKEEILTFLNHQQIDGKWVEREKDAEGKYITSFNLYLGLLRRDGYTIKITNPIPIGKHQPS
jgi:hypothetical protein